MTTAAKVELDEVVGLVRVQLGVDTLALGDHLVEDLGAESADLANVVAALEDRYDVQIEEADWADVRTVVDLHGLVERLLAGG